MLAQRRHRDYLVTWLALSDGNTDPSRWLRLRRNDLLGMEGGARTVLQDDPITPGATDLHLMYRLADGVLYDARVVVAPGRLFTLIAATPEEESDSRHFLDSFQVVSQ